MDLRIENVNDNFPYFKKPSYEATIPEGSSHNTPIEFIKVFILSSNDESH